VTEIEAVFMQGIIAQCILYWWKYPSLTEKEAGLMQGILAKYKLKAYWWK